MKDDAKYKNAERRKQEFEEKVVAKRARRMEKAGMKMPEGAFASSAGSGGFAPQAREEQIQPHKVS